MPEKAQNWPSAAQKVQLPDGGEKVTATVKLQLVFCPSVDAALACTVVVPTEKLLPDGGLRSVSQEEFLQTW